MTLGKLHKKLQEMLECDERDFEAKQIIFHHFGINSTEFLVRKGEQVSKKNRKKCEKIAKKRRKGTPLYYIIGSCEFYSLNFKVGRGVLLPRADTESLVEVALAAIKNVKNPRVVDLCSGSGCVAISIAAERPDSVVTAVELHKKAMKYLRQNIELNSVKNVAAVTADALEFSGEYDLIVCNPPYIAECEKRELSREVLAEPHTALFAENDGYLFYEKIAKNFSNPHTILFEVGIKMAERVCEILRQNGYQNIGATEDLNGILRVVKATKK